MKSWMVVETMVAWPAERQVSKEKRLLALTTQQVYHGANAGHLGVLYNESRWVQQ